MTPHDPKLVREQLAACIEALEIHFGPDFWKSPLGLRLMDQSAWSTSAPVEGDDRILKIKAILDSRADGWTCLAAINDIVKEERAEDFANFVQAVQKISRMECPKYMAHPQSVWWQTHVMEPLKNEIRKLEDKNGC